MDGIKAGVEQTGRAPVGKINTCVCFGRAREPMWVCVGEVVLGEVVGVVEVVSVVLVVVEVVGWGYIFYS